MPASLLNDAPPPVDTMGGLMGVPSGPSDDFGTGAGVVNDPSPGRPESTATSPGQVAGANSGLGGWASKGSKIGGILGSLTGVGMLGGLAGNLAGNVAEQNIANPQLSALGFEEIGPRGLAMAVANQATPFGLGSKIGLQSMQQQFGNKFGFGLGPAADSPMGGDSYGGWGGYSSTQNQGLGADLESEPGDLAAAVADAAAAAGNGGDDSYGTDGASDNNMGGYGDKGDEAPSGAGDSDEWRHGGLLGDDGDGKFEAVKGTLHENEAVLKPEAVGLLGDDVVTQLNNVASLNDTQKQKLVAGLLDAIIGGKTAKKKTDFRASR